MKKVLITGANSYVGKNVENWLMRKPEMFYVETLDMKDPNWHQFDFSRFDFVFHVAGVAHQKETKKNRNLYYLVNRDLAIEVAKKSQNDGVKNFIFMSSLSVYGKTRGVIHKFDIPNPVSAYARSKLEAEITLSCILKQSVNLTILRPPMVIGKNCPGNFQKFIAILRRIPIFPLYENRRSYIYIDNLSYFIENIILNELNGLYIPQNEKYLNITDVVRLFSIKYNKKILFTRFFNIFVKIFVNTKTISKIFGSLYYIANDEIEIIKNTDYQESIKNSL